MMEPEFTQRQPCDLFRFVKDLIAFRKKHKILHMGQELSMTDSLSCGFPGFPITAAVRGTGNWTGRTVRSVSCTAANMPMRMN